MKLHFSYDTLKDIENLKNGAKSVNSSKPTELHELYCKRYGSELEDSKIRAFVGEYVQEKGIDVPKCIQKIENEWSLIKDVFIKRCEEIFGVMYPVEDIYVYLTTNNRCTYSIKGGFFFVRMQSPSANRTIMHELLHFYTWQVFYKNLKDKGLSDLQYNDVKESLTELLNIEFTDLMGGEIDEGYPQHQEMRKKFRELWVKNKNLKEAVEVLSC